MKLLEEKRERRSLAGRLGNEKRWGTKAIEQTSQCDNNAIAFDRNKSKVKEIKVKDSKEKDIDMGKTKRFSAPSKTDIINYLISEKNMEATEAEYFADRFINFYESKNWMVGKNKMTNWKTAATRSLDWEDKRKLQIESKYDKQQKVFAKLGLSLNGELF
ncbi:MAG: hypothetical protein Q8928_02515 [Bacteroidota bacterium]|nr:hypothetical protein [Bacteroidota bacterium]